MGNFFNNLMSGLAFGMFANNPFSCGIGFGGWGWQNFNTVDFGTFANPFPNYFGNMSAMPVRQPISLFNNFANPYYPTLDFSQSFKTIWDYATKSTNEYFKKLEEYQKQLEKQQKAQPNNSQNVPTYSMPFSPWCLPAQFSGGFPQFAPFWGNQVTPAVSKEEKAETKTTTVKSVNFDYNITDLKNKWSSKKDLPDEFYSKVISISKKVKCDPNDLMGIMWLETAKTFSPSKKNGIGAVGLIQFTPNTAKNLGTSTAALAAMSATEQLDYVEKYLLKNKSVAGFSDNDTLDRGTLYSLIFLPKYSKNEVLTTKGKTAYAQNPLLDYNNDGKITKTDLASVVTDYMA